MTLRPLFLQWIEKENKVMKVGGNEGDEGYLSHDEFVTLVHGWLFGCRSGRQKGRFHHHFFLSLAIGRGRNTRYLLSSSLSSHFASFCWSRQPTWLIPLRHNDSTGGLPSTLFLTHFTPTHNKLTSLTNHQADKRRWQEGAQRTRWRPKQRTTPSASNLSALYSPTAPVSLLTPLSHSAAFLF